MLTDHQVWREEQSPPVALADDNVVPQSEFNHVCNQRLFPGQMFCM
jgi:hypothetical protein